MHRRRLLRCLIAAVPALAALAAMPVAAQEDWPRKAVTVIVPYAPGGNTDFLARLTAEHLTKAFDRPFVVENKPGAGGTLAAELASRAPADGYTLFFGTITQISIAQYLYKVRYDPIGGFQPIANVGGNPLVVTVSSNSPHKTLGDLIKFGRDNPGKLSVGHAGVGSLSHLSASLFLHRAGIKATMIPYKGGGPALADMIGGVTDMYSANISEISGQIGSGKVRFLGVSSLEPIPQLSGVPTIAQTFAGHQVETWNGVFGPAGIPPAIVDRLAVEITKMLNDPAVVARLSKAGVIPQTGQVKQAFAERIQRDIALWKPVVQEIGITPE